MDAKIFKFTFYYMFVVIADEPVDKQNTLNTILFD